MFCGTKSLDLSEIGAGSISISGSGHNKRIRKITIIIIRIITKWRERKQWFFSQHMANLPYVAIKYGELFAGMRKGRGIY